MKQTTNNPCFRCGKQRIISRSWSETITTFSGMQQKVTFTDAICPDADCQSLLDLELDKQKEKRDKITQDRQQRMLDQKTRVTGRRKVV
jgi:hypothetical protein